MKSPLRYPGGKAGFLPLIQEILSQGELYDIHYVEPYAGGAGLALALLGLERASTIHLNDLDRSIYLFWSTILNKPDRLCRRIERAVLDVDEWQRQRDIYQRSDKFSDENVAFATLYLNRTNRSGVIATAGPIGGKQQLGVWNMSARFNRDELIRRIRCIYLYAERVRIYNEDAEAFLGRIQKRLPRKSLVYLDPPYVEKGPRLYKKSYVENDHRRLARWIQTSLKVPWIVSYDDNALIRNLYAKCKSAKQLVRYSAHAKCLATEVMFCSPSLEFPCSRL